MTRFAQFLRESTFGSKPSGALRKFNFSAHSMNPNANIIIDDGAGSPDPLNAQLGAFNITGSIDTWLYPNVVSSLICSGINLATTSTDTGSSTPYTHVMSPGTSVDSFYLELGYDAVGTRAIAGCTVNGITIDGVKRERTGVSLDIIGAKEPETGTTLAAAQTGVLPPPTPPFVFQEGAITYAGSAKNDIESLSVNISNNLPDDKFRIGDKYMGDNTDNVGKREITMNADIRFEAATDYNKYIGGTKFAVVMDNTRGSDYEFKLDMQECIYTGFPTNVSGRDRFLPSAEMRALYDTSAAKALTITVKNDETEGVWRS